MIKLLRIMFVLVLVLLGTGSSLAQDGDVLKVIVIDYMAEALEASGAYDRGIALDVTIVNQPEFEGLTESGQLGEFDLVLVDNQTIEPFSLQLGEDYFISICALIPDFCAPPVIVPLPICDRFPWLPHCQCPPDSFNCPFIPPVVWDIPIIVDPWDPMPWALEDLIDVVETETVMVDPRNGVGFFLKPHIFDLARPNLTIDMDEAFLVFVAACNYVMHYNEFTEMGFLPITVEGYQETPFNVNPYIPASGNVELATEFATILLTDPEIQLGIFETTGLLPGNAEVLIELLPN